MWRYYGQERPPFADEPGAGQESVWDYPRPPRAEPLAQRVRVSHDGAAIADTTRAVRIVETASPPTVYLPPDDVDHAQLIAVAGQSHCEWKGPASYLALAGDTARRPVAWCYRQPTDRFAALADFVSFYPALVTCFIGDERVRAQPGGFYGGWVTDTICGPYKGDPSTGHW